MTGQFSGLTARPAPQLAPYVLRYQGYRLTGFAPGIHLGLPSTSLTAIISLGEEPTQVSERPGLPVECFDALIAGLNMQAAAVHHAGDQFGIQIDLHPAATRALFSLRPAELGPRSLRFADLFGPESDSLVERLRAATGWRTRFALLDKALWRRVSAERRTTAEPAVEHAWRLLTQSGPTRVADVAEQVFWSRRQLTAKFTAEYGVGPKEAARIGRFSRAVALLRADPTRSLADLAQRCSFSDQAHLTREWRGFTSLSPTEWLRDEEFPFVQDPELSNRAVSKA